MKLYFKYLKKYKWHCTLGPLFKWIEAALELMVPLVMKRIIDVGVVNGDISYILKYGAIMLGMGVLGLGCAIICQRAASIASQGFGTHVRNALFAHINTLSYREIDKIGAPSLITRVVNDTVQMQTALAMILRLVVRAPFIAVGAIVLCLITDWQIGLLVTVATVLVGLVLFIIMKKSVPYYAKNQQKLDRMSQITGENLEGARVVRAFSKRDKERARFDESADDMLQNSMKIGKIAAYLNPLTFAIINLGIAAVLFISGIKVNVGSLTSGEIIAVINYMTQILNAMIVISNMVSLFTKAHASMNRVSEVFDLKSSITDEGDAKPDFNAPAIEFNNVSFSYAGTDKYALRDISFKVEKGKTLGIIGGTGSGKSTLVNLLPRLYDCTLGEVKIFGNNVKNYSQESLRFIFGVVPQNATLFSGTVRSNLFWGNDKASDDDFNNALKLACAYDFINEKGGLDCPVLEFGRNFSGGQRQRLTIARALVANPPVFVLDDSCSALDFKTDAKVRSNISSIEDITTVIISQRYFSIKDADEILVLQDGEIVGFGKHDELYENCEIYREICDSQTRSEQ